MAESAQIHSVSAIRELRAGLCIFAERARVALDGMLGDMHGLGASLHGRQLPFWKAEVRRRSAQLEEARGELSRAQFSVLRQGHDMEQHAVRVATKRLREAEEKVKVVQRWSNVYDRQAQPLASPIRQLAEIVELDIPVAIAYLDALLDSLDAYTGAGPARGSTDNQQQE